MTIQTDIVMISFWARGTQDGEIHCLKAGGVAADSHETITTETAKLLSRVSEADDAFTNIEEDEDELEESQRRRKTHHK